jgi:hypothetical protein
MRTYTDIRAQVDADVLLQREINLALLAVADTLSPGSDMRMIRILSRILNASWTEHVSFQNEVVLPILVGRHHAAVSDLVERVHRDHVNLGALHTQIAFQFEALLSGGPVVKNELEALLRRTHVTRQDHLATHAALDGWMPPSFTAAECALCEQWALARMSPRFPLDLVRSGRPYPQFGSRLH